MPLCVCGHAFVVVLASEVCGGAGVLACLFVGRMCVVLTYEAYSSSRVERGRLQPRPAPASTCQSSPLHASPRAEVQKRAAPVILDGDDCIIQSETGSGKTLAFLLPALSRLAYPPVVYPDDLKARHAWHCTENCCCMLVSGAAPAVAAIVPGLPPPSSTTTS